MGLFACTSTIPETPSESTESIDICTNFSETGLEGYKPPGLRNIGNTCFMNSILQCVMATPYLHKYFCVQFRKDRHLRRTRLSQSFYQLIRIAREGSKATQSNLKQGTFKLEEQLADLKTQLSATVSIFYGRRQHDAQEFMRYLVDRMHNELNRVRRKPRYRKLKCEELPIRIQSQKWAEYAAKFDNSVMTDLFNGQLISVVTCLSCRYKSATFDNFMDLSVEIPLNRRNPSLLDCLDNFFSPERIANVGYKCTKCDEQEKIVKALGVYRLPRILIIHLKRFLYTKRRRRKISAPVDFPQSLDMRDFSRLSEHTSVTNAMYRLYGISHHVGGLRGGHYTSDVQNMVSGIWYHCDDTRVRTIPYPDTNCGSAYVLFYVRAPGGPKRSEGRTVSFMD